MQVSVETALCIVYQPQAIFRVRPVSRCTASMPGHAEAVLAVSFSPDGRHLASGSGDTTVRFWDLNTQLPQHTCQVSKTAWSTYLPLYTCWVSQAGWLPHNLDRQALAALLPQDSLSTVGLTGKLGGHSSSSWSSFTELIAASVFACLG